MLQPLSPDERKPPDFSRIYEMLGLRHVDQRVRQGLQFCWMVLPENPSIPDGLEAEFRSIFDRAIRDYREDLERYGYKVL